MNTPAPAEQIEDYRDLFLHDVPLLDVRAPVEFAAGAFPSARNHPLVDDAERHRIGIAYKDAGQQRAVALGETLVSGALKAERIATWRDFVARHPGAVLYCFRGGMRSQLSQQWLHDEAGLDVPRVRGGYKAMRRFLIDELAANGRRCRPVVIGGRTGVGKTRLLLGCDARIDLEGLAHHRGSAFGHHPQPQPSQIDFENAASIALLKHVAADNRAFVVEDESRNIGSRHVPVPLFDAMQAAPLVLLEASDDERVEITLQEYVHDALAEFVVHYGEEAGREHWAAYLRNSLDRIRKRLGGDRHARARTLLDDALDAHASRGDTDGHRAWIAFLLREYYDGMYTYQLEKKAQRTVFRGAADGVRDYLADHFGIVAAGTV
ncbi:MAG: tRNA 2-selenouridine(34) synthase MnmH [Gammaproteobacteria bacterium]|nr:tRNA 2-selenouridine(34) synthase MnmH [Gammaproteobacteria bacterium]